MKISAREIIKVVGYGYLIIYIGICVYASYKINDLTTLANGTAMIELNITSPTVHNQTVLMPAWVFGLLGIKPIVMGYLIGVFTSNDEVETKTEG